MMDRSPKQEAPLPRLAILALLALAVTRPAWAGNDGSATADDWRVAPPFREVNAELERWFTASPAADRLSTAWEEAILAAPRPARLSGPLLRLALETDERLASLLSDLPDAPPEWLSANEGVVHASIRLAIADELAARSQYDACLAWTEGLPDESLFSPTLLHYLRAVSLHQTIDNETGQAELERHEAHLADTPYDTLGPARSWVIEQLAIELKRPTKPLPVVARRMRDVERRLSLSQANDRTVQQHETILKELDELIDNLEKQRQEQQKQASRSAQGGGSAPGEPAEESRPSDLKGPGEVDRKRLVAGDAWGSLPPAERARLTQAITRDFPPHYRALVEDYFRTLATEADVSDTTPTDE